MIAAESQQRVAILGKWFRRAAHFRDDARILEHRVPDEIRHEHFQQRRAAANRAAGIRQPVYDGRKIPLEPRPKQRLHFSRGFGERVRELRQTFRNACPKRGGRSRAPDSVSDAARRWIPRRNPPARYRSGRSSEKAKPASPRETRMRGPCRIASFPGGGCRPARCSDETRFEETSGSSSRTMCSQNFFVRAYGS